MANRSPNPGDVYRDENGRLCLYVRTELRQGTSPESEAGEDEADHLFVVLQPESRHFATRWVRAGLPLPEKLELVVNARAEETIAELRAGVAELEAERSGLVAAMKTAVGVLPQPVANNLRRVYRETRGRLLTKDER